MATINPSIELAKIRGKIDAQQQVVSDLELQLQKAILGQQNGQVGIPGDFTLEQQIKNIEAIYGNMPDSKELIEAIRSGFQDKGDLNQVTLDQDSIRQLLYQARALLGELRVEEQHWNQEVNEEKQRRKDLGEFAKG